MAALLTIGDFARATHLSIKTLRRYHESGLLEPTTVDPHTGYRRYSTDQIPAAQIIRRFRNLDMPLAEIQAVLTAPNLQVRNNLITAHLDRLENSLARTQSAVSSLRDLLNRPTSSPNIEHRSIPATPAAAVTDVVDVKDALAWFHGAIGELHATLAAQHIPITGVAGGIFSNALFAKARGEATIFFPCEREVRLLGRVVPLVIPATEAAILLHSGSHSNVDMTYGALAAYVTQHALTIEGPIREYYLTGPHDTSNASAWRTEVAWPIFPVRPG